LPSRRAAVRDPPLAKWVVTWRREAGAQFDALENSSNVRAWFGPIGRPPVQQCAGGDEFKRRLQCSGEPSGFAVVSCHTPASSSCDRECRCLAVIEVAGEPDELLLLAARLIRTHASRRSSDIGWLSG
jgi:hypothetical protein